jgi:predicted thioredoxin/glutaredoxin
MTRVEIFTHPVCIGCREALLTLGELEAAGRIELVRWSLAIGSGRARAAEAGVTSVPTVIVAGEMRVLDTRDALERLLQTMDLDASRPPAGAGDSTRAPREGDHLSLPATPGRGPCR